MTFNSFEEFENTLINGKIIQKEYNSKYPIFQYAPDSDSSNNLYSLNDNIVAAYWLSGGMSGGNCWNSANEPVEAVSNVPDIYKTIYNIIKLVDIECKIPWITFQDKLNELIKKANNCFYEYYGNYTMYNYNYFNLKELFEFLKENGL